MNENIDLTKILKNCPTGFKLYSSVYGEVKFVGIYENHNHLWIDIKVKNNIYVSLTLEGKFSYNYDGECILFPSKDQRDWSKFSAYWYNNNEKEKEKIEPNKKEKFDPKTLKAFDKVIVRKAYCLYWSCDLFAYNYIDFNGENKSVCIGDNYSYCIPYNDETKHLVGTRDEAPDFYRYWE